MRGTIKIEENILYEDKEILVYRKQPGIAVQSGRVGSMDLEHALKNYLAGKGETPYIGVIHRLDQPVQGILVFAKNQKAARDLSRQIQQGKMEKRYLAVVDGIPDKAKGKLEDEMEKIPGSNRSRITEEKTPESKTAVLEYQVLKKEGKKALLEIKLYTGRHHQIRVQLSHRGFPILGDSKYNPGYGEHQELALCAYKLSFFHPVSRKKMEFTAMPVGNFPIV